MPTGYTYWREALKITGGQRPLTRDEMKTLVLTTEPADGFFRHKKGQPAAVWSDGAQASLGESYAEPEAVWQWIAQYPVTEEAYRAKRAGEPWPDEDSGVTASLAPPQIGDNRPPADDPVADLQAQIDAASKNAENYAEIKDDGTAAKAQAARSRLLELSGNADKAREAAKRPFFEAGKKIDLTWNPLVKAAKEAADKIRAALSAHETRKRDARVEAERMKALEASPVTGSKATQVAAPPRQPVEPPKEQIRGAYGKAAAVTTVRVPKIIDQDKVYEYMRERPELVAALEMLVKRAVKAGIDVPGVEVTEQADVR